MTVLPFNDEEEVLVRANDSPFGLSAGVFTNDLNRAHRMVGALDAGTMWINNYNLAPTEMVSFFLGFQKFWLFLFFVLGFDKGKRKDKRRCTNLLTHILSLSLSVFCFSFPLPLYSLSLSLSLSLSWQPWKGFKQSGLGQENGSGCIHYWTKEKSIYMETGDVEDMFPK